jgi:thiol-disulfide isomerase/thioredoxin
MTHSERKPTAGICCVCGDPISGDDIFHFSPSSWALWCKPCYKAEHLPNLVRIAERGRQ